MLTNTMHLLSSSLMIPVIVILIALVVVMVVIIGMFIAEVFTEHRYYRFSLPRLVDDLQGCENTQDVVRASGLLGRQKKALIEILRPPEASAAERESLAVNVVAEEQARFDLRVKVTDLIAKIAPMFGLMGTLIPLGPGIVAIGEGDTTVLANSLLIAFDTTVLGLIVAAVALLISTVRKAWYAKYMAAFESAAEIVLENANRGQSADGHVQAPAPSLAPSPEVPDSAFEPATVPAAYSAPQPTQELPVQGGDLR